MEYGYFSNQNIREVKMSVSESNIEISKQTQLAVESNIFLNSSKFFNQVGESNDD